MAAASRPARAQLPDLSARVGELHAPILLVWGGKDATSPRTPRAIDDALRAAGKPYDQITFSEADHGFFCDDRAAYNANASRQAWALTLAFLRTYMHA